MFTLYDLLFMVQGELSNKLLVASAICMQSSSAHIGLCKLDQCSMCRN